MDSTSLLDAVRAWFHRRALLFKIAGVGLLGLVYGYLYFVLQMEDYALLAATAALFVALAAVMSMTRRLDWQGRDNESGGTESRSATPEAGR